uniref:Uncharacterized protein n=1 Tax=Aegilops tauschii subsp. strangulata TaxID=200361 RepID=A0A453BB86_AEGTS
MMLSFVPTSSYATDRCSSRCVCRHVFVYMAENICHLLVVESSGEKQAHEKKHLVKVYLCRCGKNLMANTQSIDSRYLELPQNLGVLIGIGIFFSDICGTDQIFSGIYGIFSRNNSMMTCKVRTTLLNEANRLMSYFFEQVVLLNQVTTKFTEGSFQLTLALGDSWSHSCTNRLILYWKGNERCAYLDKSPSLPVASTPYAVTSKGVRDAGSSSCKRVRVM